MKLRHKIGVFIATLLVSVAAIALPPYGINLTQVDSSGDFFWGYYIQPASPSGQYIWMYDGTAGVPSNNPFKMGTIGSGLSWDGTTLSATGTGTVSSVTCGTGLTGGTITSSGTCALASTGSAGTYSGVTTDAQGRVTAGTNRSFSYTTRSLNTCYQISATRDADVSYTVEVLSTLTLTGGAFGTVYLRTYSNSSCTTGTQELNRDGNGNTGTVVVGIATNQTGFAKLTGTVQAGSYVQIVTENTTGTPTFTARPGQEVLL